jgi:hypothetical protein
MSLVSTASLRKDCVGQVDLQTVTMFLMYLLWAKMLCYCVLDTYALHQVLLEVVALLMENKACAH